MHNIRGEHFSILRNGNSIHELYQVQRFYCDLLMRRIYYVCQYNRHYQGTRAQLIEKFNGRLKLENIRTIDKESDHPIMGK